MPKDQPLSDQLKAQCDQALEKYEAARNRLKELRLDMEANKKLVDEAKRERKERGKFLRDNCPGYLEKTRARSEDEERAAIETLAYEIKMLSRTASSLCRHPVYERSWICTNSLIHSFLLAVRNLHEFLFSTHDNDDTIYAKTFVESWEWEKPDFKEGFHWHRVEENGEAPKIKDDLFRIISQRLHHITWARVEQSKLDWHEQTITKEFLKPIEQFRNRLRQELRTVKFDASVRELQETCKWFEQQQ